GAGLTANELFHEGYNGFYYELTCSDPANPTEDMSQYAATEYPITPLRYIEGDGGKTAALNPGTISFLWEGPAPAHVVAKNNFKLNVCEYVHYFKHKDGDTNYKQICHDNGISLPPQKTFKVDFDSYDIKISYPASGTNLTCFTNGVCACPFMVTIRKKDGFKSISANDDYKPIPTDNDLYNHLVFYLGKDSGVIKKVGGLIGCNSYQPLTSNTVKDKENNPANLAIIPADCVEIGKAVKYGTYGNISGSGKIFYLFGGHCLGLNQKSIKVALISDDVSLPAPYIHNDVSVTGVNPESLAVQLSYPEGDCCFLYTSEANCELSDWEGNADGENAGYIDYVVPDNSEFLYKGVYAVFPQGLNTQELFQSVSSNGCIPGRIDPSSMEVGYYTQPTGIISDNGLHANEYGIDYEQYDKELESDQKYKTLNTSYCNILRGKKTHAFLFDQYGNYGKYDLAANDYKKSEWKDKSNTRIRLTNWSNVPVCMHAESENLGGVSEYYKGLFIPPTSSSAAGDEGVPGTSFLTQYSSKIVNGEIRRWYICADKVCKDDSSNSSQSDVDYDYFKTELAYHKHAAVWCRSTWNIWTKIWIPQSIKNQEETKKGNEKNLYLPLNDIWTHQHSCFGNKAMLPYWGVAFVPWDMSCDIACNHNRNDHGGYETDSERFSQSAHILIKANVTSLSRKLLEPYDKTPATPYSFNISSLFFNAQDP
ncbi:MAG: hypothetical protein P9M15_07805, partial [Candidatus Electryoneaceae bacterium]|nr:hypothetical protein [Candidatus Electryoneaceae bacterium]